MPTTRTVSNTRKTTTTREPEAIKMLMEDHRQVEKLYKKFEKLGDDADAEKEQIISQACAALTAHAQLEEEIFYPGIKDYIKESDLIDEAEVEHQSLKDLIAKLDSGSLDNEKRDATFTVLCEYVLHHVKEEEGEIFPQVKKAKEIDLDAMGEEMAQRKAQLSAEMGLEQAKASSSNRQTAAKKSIASKKAA